MVQLGRSTFNEMLAPFTPFKTSNSVGNSAESYTKELKKKGSSYKHKRVEKFS